MASNKPKTSKTIVTDLASSRGCPSFLTEVKARGLQARTAAGRVVKSDPLLRYWDIGQGIVERQVGWGEAMVDHLSPDLRAAFPGALGFSSRNLRDMKRLYLAYSSDETWRQSVAKLARPESTSRSIGLRASARTLPDGQGPAEFVRRLDMVRDVLPQGK